MSGKMSEQHQERSWIRILSGIVMLIVFACSLTLNSLLLHVLRTKKMFFTKGNRFVGFLLMVELSVRIFGSPLIILSVFSGQWLFGDFGCTYYAFMMTMLGITSISLLSVIAIERFLVVCPKRRTFITQKSAIIIAGICLAHGLCWAIAPLIGWSEYVYEPSGLSCTPSWAPEHYIFVIVLTLTAFVVPFTCMVVSYGTIMWKVRTNIATQQISRISDRELSKTMVLIMASFLFCWTPYAIIAGLGTVGIDTKLPPEVTLLPLACAKSAGMWHPLIYGLKNGAMRKEMLKTCKKLLLRNNTIELEVDPTTGRPPRNNIVGTNFNFLGITNRQRINCQNVPNSKENDNTQVQTYSDIIKATDKNCSIFSLDAGLENKQMNSHKNITTAALFQPRAAIIETQSV